MTEGRDFSHIKTLNDLLELFDKEFVCASYQVILKRQPDKEGLQHFLSLIRKGTKKIDILGQLRNSPEGQNHSEPLIGLDRAIRKYHNPKILLIRKFFTKSKKEDKPKFTSIETDQPNLTSHEAIDTSCSNSDFFYMEITPENNPEIKTLRLKDDSDYSLGVPFQFKFEITEKKIAAIIHIFYPELSEEIVSYLNNIPYKTDVFISTDTVEKKEKILNSFSKYTLGNVIVKVFENRGRDIAPMIVGFKRVFEEYDYFIHLHSKKSPHLENGLSNWRFYLFETLLGSSEIVKSNLYLMENENIGIVFPQHHADLRKYINWGYDYSSTREILKKSGISINSESLLEFPSGSMFWGKTEAMKSLVNLNLEFSDFPEETGQVDGTLAHAIERSLLYYCEASHNRWVKVTKSNFYSSTQMIINTSMKNKLNSDIEKIYRPLFNNYIKSDSKSLLKVPENITYNTYPSYYKKPRLNLLVPTINPSEIFGGVSTAIKFYTALKENLKNEFDYRIIIDISRVDNFAKENFRDYVFQDNLNDDSLDMQIIQATDNQDIYIRKNDFFLSTAWWTASSGFRLLDSQNRFFGSSTKLLYLIQDYESNFYPWSSKWMMCENTYKEGNRTIAIFNSEELASFMIKKYSFLHAYYLPYQINENIRDNLTLCGREKKIIFYGRPNVDRNAFEFIVDGISLWQKINPIESKKWKIYSLGEEYPISWASNVENLTIIGKASLSEYADFLNTSMIGISLMVSPHPSYPPLEMAYAGMYTITNSYDGKNLENRSDNITSIEILSIEEIAKQLDRLTNLVLDGQYAPEREKINNLSTETEIFDYDCLSNLLKSYVNE